VGCTLTNIEFKNNKLKLTGIAKDNFVNCRVCVCFQRLSFLTLDSEVNVQNGKYIQLYIACRRKGWKLMGKDKGKIALLIVLLLVLYGVIYYQFIWTPKFSLDIEDINSKIETAQKQKQKLDNDLANIETLKRNLEMKTVQNERLETYLLNDSNVSDGFEYIEKLGKLFKNKLYNVKVKRPAEKKIGNSKDDKNAQSYYEIQMILMQQ